MRKSRMHPKQEHPTQFQIGAVGFERLVEQERPILDPFEVYSDATPADIERNLSWLAPRFYDPHSKLLVITIQGFVLRSGGRTILVDTCVGDCKSRRRPGFDDARRNWLGVLAQTGIAPQDVDLVVCTHFHVDHVGWNTRLEDGKWVPTFPRARYLFVRSEWEYWWSERGKPGRERAGDYMVDSVVPVVEAGLVDFIDMDHVITDEVQCLPAPGHTPGLVCIDITSGGQRAILASDLVHSPLQLRYPRWSTRFCADPELSRRTRMSLLDKWADTGVLVAPTHFPSPSAGYVERDGDAYRFRFVGE